MKVLMVTPRFIYGGIEKLLIDFFENVTDSNIKYDVLIYTGVYNENLRQQLVNLKVCLYSLHSDKFQNKFTRRVYEIFELIKFLKNNSYDVIHIHTTDYKRSFDLGCAKLLGIKGRVMHAHSTIKYGGRLTESFRPFRKLFDYTATDYCACSKSAAEYLYSKRIIDCQRYTIINNGIDVRKFLFSEVARNQIRQDLGVGSNIVVGYVGRMAHQKNPIYLIDMFHELIMLNSNYRLLLVGDGELRQKVMDRIISQHIEDKVIIYGTTNNVGKILSAMDVFILPSLWEGLGTVLIEAQCNGLPCIVSENIPNEATITSNVFQLNLNMGVKIWARRIADINLERVDESKKIQEKGFHITNTVEQLETIYRKYQK